MKNHSYGYLWNVLSLFGINLNDVSRLNSCKTVMRFLLKSPLFILYVAAIFYTFPNLILTTKNGIFEVRAQITWMIVCFLSYFLWYLTFQRRLALRKILREIDFFYSEHFQGTLNIVTIFNRATASFCVSQLAYIIGAVYCMNSYQHTINNTWTYGYALDYGIWGNLARLLSTTLLCLQIAAFPVFVSLMMSAMYLHCTDALQLYKKEMRKYSKGEFFIPFVKKYSRLLNIVKQFDTILSTPACIAMCLNLLQMFTAISMLLLNEVSSFPPLYLEVMYMLVLSACSTLFMCVSAAEVDIILREMRTEFKELYERELHSARLNLKNALLIKAMADKDIQPMSSCNTVFFTRNYIISVFGGFLTYALLIININTH